MALLPSLRNKSSVILLVCSVLVASILMYGRIRQSGVTTQEFGGQVVGIEENSIIVKGFYKGGDRPLDVERGEVTVQVAITPQTIFTKEAYYLPPAGVQYSVSDLKKDIISGSLDDLAKNGSVGGILIRSGNNIYKKDSFDAVEVFYFGTIYPE